MNNQSDLINALAEALAKAQAQIVGAKKDSANSFFKNQYADLASVWDAIREPLTKNGLSVVQTVEQGPLGVEGEYLVTMLIHSSGQWIKGSQKIITKDASPQAQGSGITYARRYGLAAIAGVAQIDDDGNAAQGHPGLRQTQPSPFRTTNAPQSRPVVTQQYKGNAPIPWKEELPDFGNTENPADLPKKK